MQAAIKQPRQRLGYGDHQKGLFGCGRAAVGPLLPRSRLDPYAPGSCLLDVDDRARFDGFSVDDGDLALDAAGQQDASWDLPVAAAAERPFQGQQGSTLIALLPTCCRQTYFLLDYPFGSEA